MVASQESGKLTCSKRGDCCCVFLERVGGMKGSMVCNICNCISHRQPVPDNEDRVCVA